MSPGSASPRSSAVLPSAERRISSSCAVRSFAIWYPSTRSASTAFVAQMCTRPLVSRTTSTGPDRLSSCVVVVIAGAAPNGPSEAAAAPPWFEWLHAATDTNPTATPSATRVPVPRRSMRARYRMLRAGAAHAASFIVSLYGSTPSDRRTSATGVVQSSSHRVPKRGRARLPMSQPRAMASKRRSRSSIE